MKLSTSLRSFVSSYKREHSCSILRGFDYSICDSLNIYFSVVKKLGEGELYKHLSWKKKNQALSPTGKKYLYIKSVSSVQQSILFRTVIENISGLTQISRFLSRLPKMHEFCPELMPVPHSCPWITSVLDVPFGFHSMQLSRRQASKCSFHHLKSLFALG